MAATPTFKQIPCLCQSIQNISSGSVCLGFLLDPGLQQTRRVNVASAPKTFSAPVKALPLKSLLPPQNFLPHLELSRKQRFGIAAAMAWAVLYLCGSPWLSEAWSRDEVHVFLESSATGRELLAKNPCVSYLFSSGAMSAPALPAATPADRFNSNQIRNKTLFALGILLIELCINSPFEEFRQQSQTGNTQTTATDDYEIAVMKTNEVYLDAGDSYGYAVQRCVRCEFPGRDISKSFDFSQFRRHFYNGVVAPVQATFSRLPASYSSI